MITRSSQTLPSKPRYGCSSGPLNPSFFYHMSDLDHGLELVEKNRALVLESRVVRELDMLADLRSNNFLSLGYNARHSLGIVEYSIGKPLNKPRTIIMQKSESTLDNFWSDFDKHIKKHCLQDIIDAWDTLWPGQEDLKRTQDWAQAEAAPLVSGLGAVNLSFGHEEKVPASDVAQLAKKKSKKKKRKAQAPTPQDTENPHPEADNGPIQPEVKIIVSKRAWEVFHSGLFVAPESKRKSAELRWQDFLVAMTALGFRAHKMFGSVWRFDPGEKAQCARLRGVSASQ